MEKPVLTSVCASAMLLCGAIAAASDLSGVVTLTSEYVYRGQTISDHKPAVSAGLDYQHDSGMFGGAWVSTIDIQTAFGQRDTELDYYLGYRFESSGSWSLAATLIRYTYPGHTGEHGYEHTELMLTAALNEHYTAEFAYTDSINGLRWSARHWGLRGEWPAATYWVVSAGAGMSDVSSPNANRFFYWDLGASIRWSRMTADLRWYDNNRVEGLLGNRAAGSRFVGSVSFGF